MKAFHAISGLPRAGSTLLCDVLNQNPDFTASSTSALPFTIGVMKSAWSNSAEIKSDLAHDREGTEARLSQAIRNVIEAWHGGDGVVFDKARGWIVHADVLRHIYPDSRIIAAIRDPRSVLASVEKHNSAFPVLEQEQGTLINRAEQMFGPDGMIGGPLTHLEDQMSRGATNIVPFIFERFVENPKRELVKLYAELELEWFDGHDFDNVEPTATDLDAMYLNKFPHQTAPQIRPPDTDWHEYIPPELGQMIINRYPKFCQTFGYR